MAVSLTYNCDLPTQSGLCEKISPLIRRIVAPNPNPYTFTGTCTYIIGKGTLAILDPGPADTAHCDALLKATAGETISHLIVTHTHRDHSPAAAILKQQTGALIAGCAPNPLARPLSAHDVNPFTTSSDATYKPDLILQEGMILEGPEWHLEAVATPGHTANHLSFRLMEENALFSGDHVMAWSTTVIMPPEGSMAAYMTSLEKLLGRPETIYWPGHGGPVTEPQAFVRALLVHRRAREAAILRCLKAGKETIPQLVGALYPDISPALSKAASFSVLAHLEDLIVRNLVITTGIPHMQSTFRAE